MPPVCVARPEFAGTAILCLFGIGAAVSVATAGAGGPGVLIVAVAHGLALAVAIHALGYAAYADTATAAGLGATTFGAGVGYVQALVAEAIGAFILVAAVFALAVAPNAPKGVHGIGIGLALATQIMVFGPLTGASVNPARTLGPDTVLSIAGQSTAWAQLLAYVAGPLVGGVTAAFLCDYITARRPAVDARA